MITSLYATSYCDGKLNLGFIERVSIKSAKIIRKKELDGSRDI